MIVVYCIIPGLLIFGFYASGFWPSLLRRHPLPPGPRPRPIVGNVADLPAKGAKGWEHWLKHRDQYGPISSVTTMGQTLILVNKFDIAWELLEKRSSKYSARAKAPFAIDLAGWDRTVTLKSSTNEVRTHRKYMAHLMGSKKAVDSFSSQQDVETRRLLVRLLNDPEALLTHLWRMTSGLMLKIIYGYNIEPHGPDTLMDLVNLSMSQFAQAVEPGAWLVDSFPSLKYLPEWFPYSGFQSIAREWSQVLGAITEQPYAFVKHQKSAGDSTVSYVSKQIEEFQNKPTPAEEYTIKWTASTMFAGGADTTPSVLSVFFLAMALFPDAQSAARKELDAIVGNRLPVTDDRDNLPYVNALVQEVLRWHPVVPLGVAHRTTDEDIYDGYRIPKGAIVVANIWSFTHDPEMYPDPMSFNPSRFLGENPQPDPKRMVFGFGRRICPGRFLADSTLFLTIARSLKVLKIGRVVKDGQEVDPVVAFTPGVVSHPSPYEVSVRPRSAECEALVRSFEDTQTEGDSKILEQVVNQAGLRYSEE